MPEILFEDEDLLAVLKPKDWLTESGNSGESLENWVREAICLNASACHRLDKATSGIVLFRKNRRWLSELNRLFEQKKVRKEYWAIVEGLWPEKLGRVETRIAPLGGGSWANSDSEGKKAVTTFRVLGKSVSKTWLQVLPKTGRTHQIRLHCRHAECPIVGDERYGDQSSGSWLALHARRLDFRHPGIGDDLRIEANPPSHWNEALSEFGYLKSLEG